MSCRGRSVRIATPGRLQCKPAKTSVTKPVSFVMPYYNGAVATVSSGPVSYKMPVPSSRFTAGSGSGTYRASNSLSSSLERPFYSSSTGSYITPSAPRTSVRSSTYTSEYRSKYTSPSRTTSVGSYTRQSSTSDDSGISSLSSPAAGRYSSTATGGTTTTSSSRERSETREPSSSSTSSGVTGSVSSSRSRDSSVLGRRYNSSSALSAADFYSKYSPANYLSGSSSSSADLGRPPRPSYLTDSSDTPTSTYSRSRSSTAAEKTTPTTTSSRLAARSLSGAGAVGGCSTTTPTSERRSRSSANNEVILHFNNGATITASNNNNDDSSSSSSSEENDDDNNGDDNGNEPKLSVAEIRRRFDGAPGSVSASVTITAPQAAGSSAAVQNGGSIRRRVRNPSSSSSSVVVVPRTSPSPVPVRKVYNINNTDALSSDEEEDDDEDEDEDEEEEEEKRTGHSGDSEDVKEMASRRSLTTSSGVAGGATDGSPRYSRQHASTSGSSSSPKAATQFHHGYNYRDESDSSILSASPRIPRHGSRVSGNERGGLAGLRNIGNTCFMNSVIQCLSNTKPLLEYLLADSHLSDLNVSASSMKGALIKAFNTVIQELWRNESDGMVVNTTALKSQIQRFAPRFMGYSQQDAQEFLRYLLEGLHEDVNRVSSKPKPILTEIDDTFSDQQKAAEAWKRYLRMDDSKVVDIFVGQLKSTLRCTVCGHCSVTFDPFWDLSLPIPSRTGQLRLQQCFDHFTREEVMDGDEKPTCAKCQMRRKCTKSFTIQKFPKILVLHLKRFSPTERFRGKLNVTVDFPLNGLDLSAYAANRGQGSMYNLYGVANHSGTTYSGHYTAYCKHPYTGDWHEYNDSRVSSISTRTVVSNEAYVLFYELSGHTSHL